jgi:cytochrome P450/glutathione S-transferase
MPYSLFYRSRPYRLISYGVSPYTEIARWYLDRLGVEYREESHVPMLHFLLVKKTDELPGLMLPEKLLANSLEILSHFESRLPQREALDPDSKATENDALVQRFYWQTGMAVRRWAYFNMLPDRRRTLRTWHRGAPWWEKVISWFFFPIMRAIMSKGLKLNSAAPAESLAEINDCFAMVESRLSDGRRYLMGDQISTADIVFAALMAPALFPAEYRGALPSLDEVPATMRNEVLRLRETIAGQYALRLYRADRGVPWRDGIVYPTGIKAFFRRLTSVITSCPLLLRFAFKLLRRFRPILVIRKTVVVSRHRDVKEILARDEEFTISEINQNRMDRAHVPFILGWDRSPQYDREAGILRKAFKPGDMERIRQIVVEESQKLLEAADDGRIDIVNGLTRVVPTRVVARFFGIPGPCEQVMMRWLRVLFYEVFLNRSDLPDVSQTAAQYADQLQDYLTALISRKKKEILANQDLCEDDFLSRLLRQQISGGDALDDDGIRRNISGILVGAVDTTSAAIAQAFDVLIDRSSDLADARAASLRGDIETVSRIVFESLRFNPQAPALLRFCRNGAMIATGTPDETTVPPGSTILLATLSAMFDPAAFPKPSSIRTDREKDLYLHFGSGMHTCFGREINMVQIPEIAMALLKRRGLKRASGRKGRMVYDGPFPDRFVMEFQSSPPMRVTVAEKQSGATIIKRIANDKVSSLRDLLRNIGDSIETNPDIQFAALTNVHFMSWFIINGDKLEGATNRSAQAYLVLELNVDGSIDDFLKQLEQKAGNALEKIYKHCVDYPLGQIADYLLCDDIGYNCFYIGWRGLSVDRIRKERELRAELEKQLDTITCANLSARKIRAKLQEVLAYQKFRWATTCPQRPFLVRYSKQIVIAVAVLAGVILLGMVAGFYLLWSSKGWQPLAAIAFSVLSVGAVFLPVILILIAFLLILRRHEQNDWVSNVDPAHSKISDVVRRENAVVQNHMASVAKVKCGWFRKFLLKAVLKVIHILAAVVSNQGNLSGINTIHFARWVVILDGKYLLFLSNYDGSWENYLDDFIDRAAGGLTAIWSNTLGFPRTRFLTEGGARDEILFKTLTRNSQVPSLVWYSAYPDLTVENIHTNAAIREGLLGEMTETQSQIWLRNF